MEIILGVATLIGGIAALWFFWDKIASWFRAPTTTPATNAGPTTAPEETVLLLDLVEELEHNQRLLNERAYATTPALRDEAWSAAHRLPVIRGPLRASLNTVYTEIRSAKGVHHTIEAAHSPHTMPEQLRLEGHLDRGAAAIPSAVAGLRALL